METLSIHYGNWFSFPVFVFVENGAHLIGVKYYLDLSSERISTVGLPG